MKVEGPSPEVADRRLRALAYGLEFSKRCVEARRLEELYLLLTNDIASVVEFDRALLLVHLDPESEFVAANNTPVLDKRAQFYEEATALAQVLRPLERGLLLGSTIDPETLKRNGLSDAQIESLRRYLAFAKSANLFCLPLVHGGRPIAHLVFEFFPGRAADETRLMALLNLAPVLAGVLAQKWLLARRPDLASMLGAGEGMRARVWRWTRRLVLLAAVGCAVYAVLFRVPVPVQVGGETEINPRVRHLAFCQTTGLVGKVLVTEGAKVTAGQTLAVMDARDLDFRIKNAERQIELLGSEMDYLQRQAAHGTIAKLAERELVDLKQQAARAELAYFRWEQQFLEIKAPVAGTVATRDVDGLAGKKLQAGEPFCEVLGQGDLVAEVLVPEDRIGLIRPGQPLALYLDTDPRHGLELEVEDVAPKAEVIPRLGAVFRVRGAFKGPQTGVMAGMKGIGKVSVRTASVWDVVVERLHRLGRRLSLYF